MKEWRERGRIRGKVQWQACLRAEERGRRGNEEKKEEVIIGASLRLQKAKDSFASELSRTTCQLPVLSAELRCRGGPNEWSGATFFVLSGHLALSSPLAIFWATLLFLLQAVISSGGIRLTGLTGLARLTGDGIGAGAIEGLTTGTATVGWQGKWLGWFAVLCCSITPSGQSRDMADDVGDLGQLWLT